MNTFKSCLKISLIKLFMVLVIDEKSICQVTHQNINHSLENEHYKIIIKASNV